MKSELLHGTLEVMILKTLTWGRMHGFGIGRWIEQQGGDALRIEEGSLYPALYRLERKGLIEPEWRMTEKNRRAKYYRLTAAGERRLREESIEWAHFVKAVGKIMDATTAPAWAGS